MTDALGTQGINWIQEIQLLMGTEAFEGVGIEFFHNHDGYKDL